MTEERRDGVVAGVEELQAVVVTHGKVTAFLGPAFLSSELAGIGASTSVCAHCRIQYMTCAKVWLTCKVKALQILSESTI
jgi:hypothetical protein